MKIIATTFLFLILLNGIQGQSSELKAQSEYIQAEEAFNSNNFENAIIHLEKAKTLLGTSNPKVQSLLVKSYSEQKKYHLASQEIESYFELASEDDSEYSKMVYMLSEINRNKVVSEQRSREEEAWVRAKEINTEEGYAKFAKIFPNSRHAKTSSQKSESITNEPLKQKRLAEIKYDILAKENAFVKKDKKGKTTKALGIFGTVVGVGWLFSLEGRVADGENTSILYTPLALIGGGIIAWIAGAKSRPDRTKHEVEINTLKGEAKKLELELGNVYQFDGRHHKFSLTINF